MTTAEETIYGAMKAAAWERAKGELRALVAIVGAQSSPRGAPGDDPPQFPFEILEGVINEFVARVEDQGLHE